MKLDILLGIPSLDFVRVWTEEYPHQLFHEQRIIHQLDPDNLDHFFMVFFSCDIKGEICLFKDEISKDLENNTIIKRSAASALRVQSNLLNNLGFLKMLENALIQVISKNMEDYLDQSFHKKAQKLIEEYQKTLDLTPLLIFAINLPSYHDQMEIYTRMTGQYA